MNLDLHQLKQAVALLGGDYETQLTLKRFADGSIHAWIAEYPEEGSVKLVSAPAAIEGIQQELDFSACAIDTMVNTLADFSMTRVGYERNEPTILTQAEVNAIFEAAVKRSV